MFLIGLALAAIQAPALPSIVAADCLDPARRDTILASDQQMAEFQRGIETYNQQWQARLDERMNALGLSAETKGKLAMQAMNAPAFAKASQDNLENLKGMMTELQAVAQGTDKTAACQHIARMTAYFPPMIANALIQWQLIDAQIDGAEQAAAPAAPVTP
ncbi:hypothetical protein [Novosphingobium colocasiae]|uniref:hypothetical protein n=1 Tax=Novosphingobium colocasiae TaxID=1256513 RepID=UPI0035B2A9C3